MTCRGAEPPSTHARTVGKVPRAHWPSAQALCARLAAEVRAVLGDAADASDSASSSDDDDDDDDDIPPLE